MAHLARSPFQAPRRVIDVSGDGTNNSGRPVTQARDEAIAAGVTINGLVILSEVPLPTNPQHTHPPGGLTAYYENNVIGGPGAFVLEAESFEFVRPAHDLQAHQGNRRWPRPPARMRRTATQRGVRAHRQRSAGRLVKRVARTGGENRTATEGDRRSAPPGGCQASCRR